MKVGFHVDETWQQIIKRKLVEDRIQNIVFWGYNGTICRPLIVQEFVAIALEKNVIPKLVLSFTPSKYISKYIKRSKEFSVDGKRWFLLPNNVKVKGSKYAIVCHNLRKEDSWLDLDMYRVACGKRKGTRLSQYIRYRIDKACAIYDDSCCHSVGKRVVKITYVADLKEPYAVFIRGFQ